jgi:hypothetical protein
MARIEVARNGYKGPCSVVQVGDVAWVLGGQLNTLFDLKASKPGPFRTRAVPLPSR